MKIKICYVSGCEGNHIQIGDYRVCGPKTWGGGTVLLEWTADSDDIINAVVDTIERNKPEVTRLGEMS